MAGCSSAPPSTEPQPWEMGLRKDRTPPTHGVPQSPGKQKWGCGAGGRAGLTPTLTAEQGWAAGVQGQWRCDGLSPSHQRPRWEEGVPGKARGKRGAAVAGAGQGGASPSVGGTWAVIMAEEHHLQTGRILPGRRAPLQSPGASSPSHSSSQPRRVPGWRLCPRGPKPLASEAGSSKNNCLPGLSFPRRACV